MTIHESEVSIILYKAVIQAKQLEEERFERLKKSAVGSKYDFVNPPIPATQIEP